jgi:uncharacterized protein YggT (Ycf19 family)
MGDFVYRLAVLIWFMAYMASIYLALHIVVAHLSKSSENRLLWFFGVLTGPLTRPIRAVVPAGTSAAQIRYMTLAVCVIVWLATRLLLAAMAEGDRYLSTPP